MNPHVEVFDVSSISILDYRKGYRTFRIIGLVGTFLIGAGLIVTIGVLAAKVQLESLGAGRVAEIAFVTGIGTISALFAVSNAPMAHSLEIGPVCVQLKYQGGRSKLFLWKDPRLSLTLYQYAPYLPNGKPFPFSPYGVSTFHPQHNSITKEAFEAILAAARSAGLDISVTKPSIGTARTLYKIRVAAATKATRTVTPAEAGP
jgi:hypothetical protein